MKKVKNVQNIDTPYNADRRTAYLKMTILLIVAFVALALFFLFQNLAEESNTFVLDEPIARNENRVPSFFDYDGFVTHSLPSEYIGGGLGLLVWRGIEQTDFPQDFIDQLFIDTPQDVLTASVSNMESQFAHNFILKVFYQYEEIPFQVLGASTYSTEFLFSLAPGSEGLISFTLDSSLEVSDHLSALTVGVFSQPELFIAGSLDEDAVQQLWDAHIDLFDYRILDFEINYGNDAPLTLPYLRDPDDFSPFELGEGRATMLGLHFNPRDPWSVQPPSFLRVSSAEVIDFHLLANVNGHTMGDGQGNFVPFPPTEDYLIIALVDWHQVSIDDAPYLHANVLSYEDQREGWADHTTFSITAPSEPGFHEVVMLLVPGPTHTPPSEYTFFPLEVLTRFTLEVVASED